MKKISSKGTFYYKRIFPAVWFGFLGIFILIAFIGGAYDKGPKLPLLIVPLALAAFGYFLMKKLVFDLMEEVFDEVNRSRNNNRGKNRLSEYQKHKLHGDDKSKQSNFMFEEPMQIW